MQIFCQANSKNDTTYFNQTEFKLFIEHIIRNEPHLIV
jgi:hypothetical protein